MRLTFLVSLLGIALLYTTLWKYEMAAKNARQLRGCARCWRRGRCSATSAAPLRPDRSAPDARAERRRSMSA